jgi:hypothetical protein
MRRLLACAVVFSASVTTAGARADDANASSADRLFNEANGLVQTGHYAEACPKFEQSQKLDPAIGTQFNLADCFEHVGRTASAYLLFGKVADLARETGKVERERSARARATALEPKLAHLKVTPAPSSQQEGLELREDDRPLARSDWGRPVPVDPGSHAVSASAPGRLPWHESVKVAAGATVELTAPALARTEETPPPVAVSTWNTQKTLAVMAAGVGVVGVAVGSVAGLLSLSKHSAAEGACPSATYHFQCPTAAGQNDWNSASSLGTVSTIAFIAGGVGVVAASLLWLTAPSGPAASPPSGASSPIEVAPMVGTRSTGLALRTTW